jgi:hypothetical protein
MSRQGALSSLAPFAAVLVSFVAPAAPIGAQGCVANQLSFTRTDYAIGAQPKDVVVGDWNNDGVLDLATTNAGSNSLSVWLGGGGGAFGAATSLALPAAPSDAEAADIDADGVLDLALVYGLAQQIELRLGDGVGGFAVASTIATSAAPAEIVLTPLDGDALLDLAVTLPAASRIDAHRGSGGGAFAFATATPVPYPCAILRAADLNADGRFDLCSSTNDSGWNWKCVALLGDGGAGFTNALSTNLTGAPLDLDLADLDQDGRPDLVTPTYDFGDIFAESHLGLGNGMFGAATDFLMCAQPLALGDLDLDGKLDAIGRKPYSNANISWCLGLGGGSFWSTG